MDGAQGLLEAGRHRNALQFADFLVVHIDTDVCDHKGFDVARHDPETQQALSPSALRKAAVERLIDWMGEDFIAEHGDKVLFAVAVDGIECWLLPLLENQKKKQGKTAGCLDAANNALRKAGRPLLKTTQGEPIRPYEDAAKPFRKRKTLLSLGPLSPSLAAFLDELEARGIEIPEDDDE